MYETQCTHVYMYAVRENNTELVAGFYLGGGGGGGDQGMFPPQEDMFLPQNYMAK